MARFWLGPWEWATMPMPHWRAPAGSVGLIDLRSTAHCALAGPVPQGEAIFVTPDAVTLIGYTLLGQAAHPDDITLGPAVRSAWAARFGLPGTPTGPSLTAVLMEHLLLLSDPTGEDRVRPIVPARRHWELWLAGICAARREFSLADASVVKDQLQRQYRAARIAVLEGRLPPDHHRKILGHWVRKYGVPREHFQPADLQSDTDLPPTTTITESFPGTSATLGGDLTWTEVVGNWENVAGECSDNTSPGNGAEARAESDLSSDDHYAQLNVTSIASGGQLGTIVRFAAAASTYYAAAPYQTDAKLYTYKFVAGTPTTLASPVLTLSIPEIYKTQIDGSSLKVYQAGVERVSVTDTAVTGNLRCGLFGFTQGTDPKGDNFEAADLAVAADIPYQPWAHRAPVLAM